MVDSLCGVLLVNVQNLVEEDLKQEHDNAIIHHHNMVELTVSERKKKVNHVTLKDAQVTVLLIPCTVINFKD